MNRLMIWPMAFYVFYIGILGALNFRTRFRAVLGKQMDPRYFKTYQGDGAPEHVVVMGRHYDNQFQAPMLFLITCLTYMTFTYDFLSLILAWAFVGSRMVHTYFHLGRNFIPKRAAAFFVGMGILLAMWVQLCYFAAVA